MKYKYTTFIGEKKNKINILVPDGDISFYWALGRSFNIDRAIIFIFSFCIGLVT